MTANDRIFLCSEKKKTYIDGFRVPITYYDCAVEISSDGYSFQQYEYPPYKVIIANHQTEVSKIKEIHYSEHFGMEGADPAFKWESVFTMDSAIELPWHDFDKCVQKLKLLTTFS